MTWPEAIVIVVAIAAVYGVFDKMYGGRNGS